MSVISRYQPHRFGSVGACYTYNAVKVKVKLSTKIPKTKMVTAKTKMETAKNQDGDDQKPRWRRPTNQDGDDQKPRWRRSKIKMVTTKNQDGD